VISFKITLSVPTMISRRDQPKKEGKRLNYDDFEQDVDNVF